MEDPVRYLAASPAAVHTRHPARLFILPGVTVRHRIYRAARFSARARPVRSFYRELAHRNRLPIKSLSDMPVDPVFDVRVDRTAHFTYIGDAADVVAAHLYWGNLARWEAETWREFVPLARRARGFVDIGAFTGSFTLVACAVNPAVRCLSFEPVPRVYERLVENVEVNRWQRRVAAINAAVSAEVGTAHFHLPSQDLPDTGHLDVSRRVPNEPDGRWITVPTTTVAASLPEGFAIDLVKIDVEDAEGPVVRGMADVLSDHAPTIIIELLATGSHEEAVTVLDQLGYEYFYLAPEGRHRIERPIPVEGDPYMNFLCVPRRRRR